MQDTKGKNTFLILAAMLSATAAMLHLACIYFGAPLFRFLGTEEMAKMVEAGNDRQPILVCIVLGLIFFIWAAYALSGAGVIRKLPLLRTVLCGVTFAYLARGLAFPLISSHFPENSMTFWYISSSIVLTIGIIHLMGLKQIWNQ